MATRRRQDRSSTDEQGEGKGGSDASPFAKLAGMRAALPEGPALTPEASSSEAPSPTPARRVIVRRTSAGRGGKTVTLVERLALPPERLEELARELKRALGCGASVDGDVVVLQGDQQERARALLLERGLAREVVVGSR